MKKLYIITTVLLSILLTACGSQTAGTQPSEAETQTDVTTQDVTAQEDTAQEDTAQESAVEMDTRILDFGEKEDFPFTGFSGNEQHFRWTDSETATVTFGAMTPGKDYVCRIVFGSVMPDFIFHDSVYPVRVMLNDDEDTAQEVEIHFGESEFSFEIDGSALGESNTLSFQSELWRPSDHGSKDTRTLGINFDKVIIEPVEGEN